jgi:transposase
MARTRPWEVSDELWEQVAPLIPAAPSHAKGGRPRLSDRRAFEAIVYVLRTGIQWNALPRELGRVQRSMIAFRNGSKQASSKRCGKCKIRGKDGSGAFSVMRSNKRIPESHCAMKAEDEQ